MSKRILVVAHDPFLRLTRTALLRSAGYEVETAESDDSAISTVDNQRFDVVLIGRRSRGSETALDQRLRDRYPQMLILKIAQPFEPPSSYPSRITDPHPARVLMALKNMLERAI
jgi:DNA-binding NtrC family response regulator